MSLSNRVIKKIGVADKCPSFQAAFLQFLQMQRNMATLHEIPYEALSDKLQSKEVTLVDVRDPEELKDSGKIPGSHNIPMGQLDEAFSLPPAMFLTKYGFQMPDPESTSLVLSCKSGHRAALAYDKLLRMGYVKTQVYTGSFLDWVEKGGPLEKV